MKFVKLTYFRTEKQFGTSAGETSKEFLMNLENVERITPYKNSTKFSMRSGEQIEVVEKIKAICELLAQKQ